MLKNRDMINNSIRAYAAMPATKMFIQQYLQRANVHAVGKERDTSSAGFSEMQALVATAAARAISVTPTSPVKGAQRRPSLLAANSSVGRKKSIAPPPLNTASR